MSGCSPSPATIVFIRLTSIEHSVRISGNSPFLARTCPERLSAVVMEGSRSVPNPHNPPAVIWSRFPPPPCMLVMVVSIGSQCDLFPFSILRPGPMMISSPSRKVPSTIEPPITPPVNFVGRVPGLLTSNERAMCMTARSSASRFGVGIVFSIASMRISRLTSWCAETGMIGASSAMVPLRKVLISL